MGTSRSSRSQVLRISRGPAAARSTGRAVTLSRPFRILPVPRMTAVFSPVACSPGAGRHLIAAERARRRATIELGLSAAPDLLARVGRSLSPRPSRASPQLNTQQSLRVARAKTAAARIRGFAMSGSSGAGSERALGTDGTPGSRSCAPQARLPQLRERAAILRLRSERRLEVTAARRIL